MVGSKLRNFLLMQKLVKIISDLLYGRYHLAHTLGICQLLFLLSD